MHLRETHAMSPAERIAAAVLESHAASYWATLPTQFVARQKVIESAAKALQPILDETAKTAATRILEEWEVTRYVPYDGGPVAGYVGHTVDARPSDIENIISEHAKAAATANPT